MHGHIITGRTIIVWSALSAEYGSTGHGGQSCSWAAEQGKMFFPVTFRRLIFWFRATSPAVPSRASLLIIPIPTLAYLFYVFTGFLPMSATATIYLHRQPPPGQSRVYQATQLLADGVHCRESAGTGPVVLKVVPVTGAAFLGVNMDQSICVCVCVSSHSFWTSSSLDVPAGVTQEKVTQDFSSTFLRCVPSFFSREGFSHSFPSSTVKSNFVY